MVQTITGIPKEDFLKVAQIVGEMGRPDKVMTIVYAVGLTHHTTGSQLIRSAAVLQLLLGNIGRPGGGMNAERGHANIQGNTDNAISWEILPGYLKVPLPGQKTIEDYVKVSASKRLLGISWNSVSYTHLCGSHRRHRRRRHAPESSRSRQTVRNRPVRARRGSRRAQPRR